MNNPTEKNLKKNPKKRGQNDKQGGLNGPKKGLEKERE